MFGFHSSLTRRGVAVVEMASVRASRRLTPLTAGAAAGSGVFRFSAEAEVEVENG
jgi:hypothetical protein